MSFSPFYISQLSNEYYIEHHLRSPPPATGRRQILPYHIKPDSPCEHNLPTPCPPSTPILVQLTNSGRSQYVPSHQGPTDNLLQKLHSDLINRSAIYLLNELNKSPAVEAVSPINGSRHDHSFYICRLCHPKITHIMNMGATLHHITQHHISDRYDHRNRLTQAAFGHLTEIRRLLQQTNDRRVFTIIRSSSDSLPNITWRGNDTNSDINSLTIQPRRTPTIGTPNKKVQKPPTPILLSRSPTNRSVKVNMIPPIALNMINAGLSLNLSAISSNPTNRLEYTKQITGVINTPLQKNNMDTEPQPLATSTPRTRNGGVRKGTFDKHHNFRRFRS